MGDVSADRPCHLLFICSRNKWRSRTAEHLYRNFPGYVAQSAGTQYGSGRRVTAGMIGWADWIFVMETKHREYLERKFPDAVADKQVVCLRIPDEFLFNDPDLVALLKATLSPYIAVPEGPEPSPEA